MSGSLLSWDDYEEDENPKVAAAAKAVKEIDTTEAMKELEKQAMAYTAPSAPLTGVHPEILQRAMDAIAAADHQLTYGGRLKVEDKRLLNSATDLNQLVPFKFEWAWAGYLESCASHWMPAEVSLEKDRIELKETTVVKGKTVYVTTANERKVLCNMLVNHIFMKRAVPNMAWLNLYRLMENPEGRQYLLRQVFEETLMDHAMSNIQESLGLMTFKLDNFTITRHLHLLEESYKHRYDLLRKNLPMFIGENGTTEGIENVREFLIELVILYGFADWITYVVPLYQVIKLSDKTGRYKGLANSAHYMLRDLVHHQQVFNLILDTAIAENPEAINDTLRADLVGRMKKLITAEEDIISLLNADHDDYLELAWFMKAKLVEIQTKFGIHAGGNDPIPTPYMVGFMHKLKELEINLHGGGASVTATGGGSLAWN